MVLLKNKFKLLCFEGIDGSGKSTNIRLTYEYLKEQGFKVKVCTFVTKRGEFFKTLSTIIDDIPQQLYCDLFAFERFKSIRKRLLNENTIDYDVIISNRYLYTDLAYSIGYGRDTNSILTMLDKAITPDLNLLFDVDANIAMDRIYKRNKAVWKRQENIELLSKTRCAYLDNAEKYNFKIIDTNRSANLVFDECINHVNAILNKSSS